MRLTYTFFAFLFFNCLKAQLLTGQFDPDHLTKYPVIADTFRVEQDSFGRTFLVQGNRYAQYFRKAEALKVQGKWVLNGIDSIQYLDSLFHVYTLEQGVAHGPYQKFVRVYNEDHYDIVMVKGKFKNGEVEGKVRNTEGGYFYCNKGVPEGKFQWFFNYYPRGIEKGHFKKGMRDGRVKIKSGRDLLFDLNYDKGFLRNAQLPEESWDLAAYIQGIQLEGQGNFHYFLLDEAKDTIQTFTLYGTDSLSKLYFNLHRVSYDGDTKRYFIGPVDSARISQSTYIEVLEKREILWFYPDGKTLDTAFYMSRFGYPMTVKQKSGNVLYHDSAGRIAAVKLNYSVNHDIQNCLYGIWNADSSEVLPTQYEVIYWSDPIGFIVKKDGLFGVYSWEGKELFAPRFHDMKAVFNYRDPENPDNSFANAKELQVNTFSIGGKVSDQFELVVREGKNWGIINQQGTWVLPKEHQRVYSLEPYAVSQDGDFSSLWCKNEGFYKRCFDSFKFIFQIPKGFVIQDSIGLWGVLNHKLNWVIEPQFKSIDVGSQYFNVLTLNRDSEFNTVVTDKEFRPIFKDTLNAYPQYEQDFIRLLRYVNRIPLYGLASHSGQIWLKPNYRLIYPVSAYQHRTGFKTNLFIYEENIFPKKTSICDTIGHYLGPFDELSILWPVLKVNGRTRRYELPETYLFVTRSKSEWDLVDIRGISHLPNGIEKSRISEMWVFNTLLHIQCGDTVHSFYIPDGSIKPVNWDLKAMAKHEFNLQRSGDYAIFKSKSGQSGILEIKSGRILVKPEYHKITVDGKDFILHFLKGKQVRFSPNGQNANWKSYTSYLRAGHVYAVSVPSGTMGFAFDNGNLATDTVFDQVTYLTSNTQDWFYAIKGDSIYGFDHRLKPCMPPLQGMNLARLNSDFSILATKEGKKTLFNHLDSSLLAVDVAIDLDGSGSLLYYKTGKFYGASNQRNNYQVPAKYEKLWERYPLLAKREGKWAILDSTGAELGLYSQSEFCRQNLNYMTFQYVKFYRQSGINESRHSYYKATDSFTWSDNLVLLLNLENTELSSVPVSAQYTNRIQHYYPDSTTHTSSFYYQVKDRNPGKYFFTLHLPLQNKELLSAVRPIPYQYSYPARYAFETYWMSPDSVLKKLELSDFIRDETALASLLTQEFIRLNFQIDECPDLSLLFSLFKQNFYLKKEGLCFAIKLTKYPNSHAFQYGEVLLKWDDLKPVLKEQSYLNSLLSN